MTELTWTLVFSLWKKFTQPEIKVRLEFCFNLGRVLLDFQSFTVKPVFECAFAHPIMLFLSYLVKNSVDRVCVICKLAMNWYLMRMCASRLLLWHSRLLLFIGSGVHQQTYPLPESGGAESKQCWKENAATQWVANRLRLCTHHHCAAEMVPSIGDCAPLPIMWPMFKAQCLVSRVSQKLFEAAKLFLVNL